MGMDCPNGHGHQPFVKTITIDGNGATTSENVVARVLACGCTVGIDEYRKMQTRINEINRDAANQMEQIRSKAASARAAAWEDMRTTKAVN